MYTRIKDFFLQLEIWKRYVFSFALSMFLILVLVLLLRILVGLGWIVELPSKIELAAIHNPLASELYTNEGKLIGKFYSENRSYLKYEQLNAYYKNALIATEDRRFYNHNGVDNKSILRVLFKSILLQNESSGGGSTITQQLVKNLYPRKRFKLLSTVINKFREMAIAKRIEKLYTKDEILLLYSNTVSFGERVFGLQTASKRFFNKAPEDLLLEEAATLVGILKGPSYYSPRSQPIRASKRRNTVLAQMAKYEFITSETVTSISKLPLILDYQTPSNANELARYFKQHIKKEFKEWTLSTSKEDGSKYNLYSDGLKVYTTLDYDLQIAAEKNMQSHMSKLQKIFERSWEGGRMFGKGTKLIDDHILKDTNYKSLRAGGKTNKEALKIFTTQQPRELWTWNGYAEESATKIDSIKHYLSLLHAGILAADPKDGSIKAWVGGNDFGHFQWDNVSSPRQVGSTFKPIVYLAALEKDIDPCKFYENELRTYKDYDDWTPRNANGKYGGVASMKGGLMHSLNTVSVQVLFEAGIPAVVSLAKRLGIDSKLNAVPSLVLGTSDISLYEMVSVYSVFANNGIKNQLKAINKIEDKEGNILYEREGERATEEPIVAKEKIEVLNELLGNVTSNGTARRLYNNYQIPFSVKGKTGTTQNQSDGWFIAYSDDLVVGAWVGTQDRRMHFRNLGTGSGGRTALPLVAGLLEYAGAKNKIRTTNQTNTELLVSCPDTLSAEQYAYYQEGTNENKIENIAESFLNKIFKRRSKNSRQREQFEERKLKEQRQKDLEARIAEYNRAKEKWEKRLEQLKKKHKNK